MGGQIDAALITTSTARNPVATGKARMLAVTSAARVAAYADVPTIAERGFPGYDMDDWFGLFAATGTPESAIERLQAAVTQAAKDPQLAAALAPLGIVLVGNISAEFASWMTRQRKQLHKLAKAKGDWVMGRLGWQDFSVVTAGDLEAVDINIAPASAYLGALGSTGITAWFGLMANGQPKAGETVLVSAASGEGYSWPRTAVGSLVPSANRSGVVS